MNLVKLILIVITFNIFTLGVSHALSVRCKAPFEDKVKQEKRVLNCYNKFYNFELMIFESKAPIFRGTIYCCKRSARQLFGKQTNEERYESILDLMEKYNESN